MSTKFEKHVRSILAADAAGRKIEYRRIGYYKWYDRRASNWNGEPPWFWNECEYRISPKPIEIELWRFPDGKFVVKQPHHFENFFQKRGCVVCKVTIPSDQL